ncbi:unnamed protein product [Lymnaea stagnalis]|uniref:T-box domain-containing protein n=1 Tax=Lymnaea stagnalis TaxID=6523 RepID=A0AAV2ID33_LYMST
MTLSCKAQAFSVANLIKPSAPRDEFGTQHHLGARHPHLQLFDILRSDAEYGREDIRIELASPDRKLPGCNNNNNNNNNHNNNICGRLSPDVMCGDPPVLAATGRDKSYEKSNREMKEPRGELKQSRDLFFPTTKNTCSRGTLGLDEGSRPGDSHGSPRADTHRQRIVEANGRLAHKQCRPRCHSNGKKCHEPQRLAPGSPSVRRQRLGAGEERGGQSSGSVLTGATCFCHGEISYCHHPGVQTVTDSNAPEKPILVELCHADLWTSFHRLGTEMIITKSGRRMFPSMKMRVSGLNPEKLYTMRLEFLQPDTRKYRYMYHSSRWMVSGSGEAMVTPPCHVNPEGPISGQAICSQIVSFERLKMTNTESSKPGQVSLVSMQKFQPQVVIEEVSCGRTAEGASLERYIIMFPQTSFMAVTAYQNQQITTLKIASNPFAKGFRESGKTRVPYEAIMGSYPNIISYNTGLGYLPGLPLLSGMYQGNGSNTRKRCYSESLYEDAFDMEPKSQILKPEAQKSMSILPQLDTISPYYESHPVISQSCNQTPYDMRGRDYRLRHQELTNHVIQVLNQRAPPPATSSAAPARSTVGSEHVAFSFSKQTSDLIEYNPKTVQALPPEASQQFTKANPSPVSPSSRHVAESIWSRRHHFVPDPTVLCTDLQDGRLPVFKNAKRGFPSHHKEEKNYVIHEQIQFRSRSVSLGRSPSAVSSSPRCKTEPSRTGEEIVNGSDVIKLGLVTMAVTPWSNRSCPFQSLHLA